MQLSYILSLYSAIITLLLTIEENDYKQGLDYNLLSIHLNSILLTYVAFTILLSTFILYLITAKNEK